MRRAHHGNVFVGPSGWSYKSWAQTTNVGLPARDRLPVMARLFNAIEVNGSFYRQIRRETYALWRDQTPDEFRFTAKGHRYLTHYKRLGGVDDSIARMREQIGGLGDKLAAVLWQLPSAFTVDLARLDDFLRALRGWPEARHAIELRHRSWFCDEVRDRLSAARVAACISDAPDFPMWDVTTTDLVYVRLHGHTRKYASSYSAASLRRWRERILGWAAEGRDVHVYFDNDAEGAAVRNGIELGRLLGLSPPGRMPDRIPIDGPVAVTAGR